MDQRTGSQLIAGLTLAALFATALVRTGHIVPDWQDAGRALTAVSIIVFAYDRLLWRGISVPGRPPVLRGTWEMQLTRAEGHPANLPAEEKCYLRIQQTASQVHAQFLFQHGTTRTTTALFFREPGNIQLLFFYEYEPLDPTGLDPIRRGAASLKICGKRTVLIDGKYWNWEHMRGHVKSTGHSPALYDHFEQALDGRYGGG